MTKKLTQRHALLSAAFLAVLIPAMGADCGVDTTGIVNGLTQPTTGAIQQAVSGQPGPVPELSVGSSATQVDANQTYNFGATAVGGQEPYYYYWMRSDEAGWSQGGPAFATTANFPANQTRTMYCQVVDSAGNQSNLVEITLSINQAAPPGCTSVAGSAWTSTYGNMTLRVSGSSVSGEDDHGETITGTLTKGDGACADCWTMIGRWKGVNNQGDLNWVFAPDLMSFSGGWGYDGSSWGGSWTGSRSSCN